jgi:acyl-CoA thioester hydrolase
VQIRFKDLDAMGHVNNAVFFTYFELGREAYMRAIDYPDPGFGEIFDRFPFILAEISCQFLQPIRMDDEVTSHIRVDRIGTKSWGFQYLLTRAADGAALATGRSTQVFFDYRTRTSAPVPDWFVSAVETFEGQALR